MNPAKLLSIALTLTAAAGLAGVIALRLSLPTTEGKVRVSTLHAEVTIRFDPLQRPYVEAGSLSDALAAQGWLHASHRLWQMELFRRAGLGRMAEMLGKSQISTDEQLWRFGVPQLARTLEANADKELLALVDAYIGGVNAAIEDYILPPPEFLLLRHGVDPWQRSDVFALGALMAFQSANNADRELLRLALRDALTPEDFALFLDDNSARQNFPYVLPQQKPWAPPARVLPQADSGRQLETALARMAQLSPSHNPLMPRFAFGSNGWVVAPERSTSGHALHAFDSHDALGLPNLFYEVHLFFGDGREIRGWSVPGLPGVINGYNEAIAWGFTNIGDTQDLFLETRNATNPELYLHEGQWQTVRREAVSIAVKDADSHSFDVLHTANGPLISEEPPIALRWTVQDIGDKGLDAILALNVARDWDEFNAALDRHAAPTLNATYADVHGTIGFRTAGLLPVRARGNGLVPLDGRHADSQWVRMVLPQDMPRLKNPPSGFIAAANARVAPEGSYPLVSADNAAPYRVQRLQDVLAAQSKLSLQDMAALQMDWFDSQADALLGKLLDEVNRDALSPTANSAMDLLTAWSNSPIASKDSAAALIFQSWYLQLGEAVFSATLPDALYQRLLSFNYGLNFALDTLLLTDRHSQWWQNSRSLMITKALELAVQQLLAQLSAQPAAWRLDQLQAVGLQHELSKALPTLELLFAEQAQPWGGSPAAVGRANYSYRKPFSVVHGATVRTVADMSTPPKVGAVIPGGQSGHPLSAHYTDQFPVWVRGDLTAIYGSSSDASNSTIKLSPD